MDCFDEAVPRKDIGWEVGTAARSTIDDIGAAAAGIGEIAPIPAIVRAITATRKWEEYFIFMFSCKELRNSFRLRKKLPHMRYNECEGSHNFPVLYLLVIRNTPLEAKRRF